MPALIKKKEKAHIQPKPGMDLDLVLMPPPLAGCSICCRHDQI
jgi:hypothetical protein